MLDSRDESPQANCATKPIGVVGHSQGRDDQKSLLQIIHDASMKYSE